MTTPIRAYIAVTSSFLTQTIDGLDALLQMPFGCGEQNMIVFAPDVYITKYLQGSGQLKPEIMAKAEKLMITGYQRELTYRRTDGSFSAFGMTDQSGSLWLTAFVLKVFAQAKGLMYIDESVLATATKWITSTRMRMAALTPSASSITRRCSMVPCSRSRISAAPVSTIDSTSAVASRNSTG
jgi:CD109 antigen